MKNLAKISCSPHTTENWQRFPIGQLEDLHNLVLGADLNAVQMNCTTVGGCLAFWASDGVIFSSGHVDGDAIVKGVISDETVAVGIILSQGQNSR